MKYKHMEMKQYLIKPGQGIWAKKYGQVFNLYSDTSYSSPPNMKAYSPVSLPPRLIPKPPNLPLSSVMSFMVATAPKLL